MNKKRPAVETLEICTLKVDQSLLTITKAFNDAVGCSDQPCTYRLDEMILLFERVGIADIFFQAIALARM